MPTARLAFQGRLPRLHLPLSICLEPFPNMAETLQRNAYALNIEDLTPCKFLVQQWEMSGGLNQCYRIILRVLATSSDLAIDNEALGCKARLSIDPGDGLPSLYRWGLVDVIEDLGPNDDGKHHWYQIELVPQLSDLQYSFHSRSWVKQSQDQEQIDSSYTTVHLLQDLLREHGIQGDAVRWDLDPNNYPQRDFIVQYEETDLEFLHRWLEHEGISYYFQFDEQQEILVFCDQSNACPDLSTQLKSLPVLSGSGSQAENYNAIWEISSQSALTPDSSINRDWNWRTPEKELELQAPISEQAYGTGPWEALGEHYKNSNEGERLAKMRAEMHQVWQLQLHISSSCRYLLAGHAFVIQDASLQHFSTDRHIVADYQISGSQAVLEQGDDAGADFKAQCCLLDGSKNMRPRIQQAWPRVPGVIQGRIVAIPGGSIRHDGAAVDEDGRYLVQLCFDDRQHDNEQSSRPIRMMQPNMGAGTGMHWLLPPGTEVLIGFTDGNPDRPIILGSIAHGEDTAPVLAQNSSEQIMKTNAGHFSINDDNSDNPVQTSGDGSGKNMEMHGKNIFNRLHEFRKQSSSSDFSAAQMPFQSPKRADISAMASSVFSSSDESTSLSDPNSAFWSAWNNDPPSRGPGDIKMHSVDFEDTVSLETGADGDTGDLEKELNTLGNDVTADDKIDAAWVGYIKDYDRATWDGNSSPYDSPELGADDVRNIRVQHNHIEVVSKDQIDLHYGTSYIQYWSDVINRDGGHTWNIYNKDVTNKYNIFDGGGVVIGGGSEYKYTRAYAEFNGVNDRFEMVEGEEQKDINYSSLAVELNIGILDVQFDNRNNTAEIEAGPEIGIEINIRGVNVEFCTFETDMELFRDDDDDNANAKEIDLGLGSFSLSSTVIEKNATFQGLLDLDIGLIRIQNGGTCSVIEAVAVTVKNGPITKNTNTTNNRISLLALTRGIIFEN